MLSSSAILAAIILPIMLLLLALLISPIHIIMNISKRDELVRGSLNLTWLGVAIKRSDLEAQSAEELIARLAGRRGDGEIEVENDREEEEDHDRTLNLDRARDKARDQRQGRKEGDDRRRAGPAKIRPQRLIRAVPQLAGIFYDLLSSIVFRISGRILLGLDDPAETAILSGQVWALSSALGRSSSQLSIDPWFEGARLEGEVFVEMQVRLVWGLAAVLQALRIKEVRQTGMEMLGWI